MTQGLSLRLHHRAGAGAPGWLPPTADGKPCFCGSERRWELVADFPSLATCAHSDAGIDLQGVTLAYVANRTTG